LTAFPRLLTGRAARWLVMALLLLAGFSAARAQDYSPVSTVNGDVITREAFFQRLRFVRWQYLREIEMLHSVTGGNFALMPDYLNSRLSDLRQPAQLGDAVLTQLEEERLLWQTGEALGVVPTLEDAQETEAAFFSGWTGVAVDKLATDPTAQEFIARWYANATAASGLSENDIRIVFETEALRAALYNHLAANVPREEPAVFLRGILCAFHPDNPRDTTAPTEAERAAAQDCVERALDQLAFGQPFANVAAAYSQDSGSGSGGALGWILESYLAEPYLKAIEGAADGAIVGPVEMPFGLHIIQVDQRRMQPLTDSEFQEAVQGYFRLWLEKLWADATVTRAPDWDANLPADPDLSTLSDAVRADVDAFLAAQGAAGES